MLRKRRTTEIGVPVSGPAQLWTPPPELSTYIPRNVGLSAVGRVLAGCAMLLVLGAVMSAVLLAAKRQVHLDQREFRTRESVSVTGEVVRIGRRKGDGGRRDVFYRYAAGGREWNGEARLRERTARDLRLGSAVSVQYIRSRPEVSWLAGNQAGTMPLGIVILIPAAMILTAGLFVLFLNRQRRLLTEGRAARARLLSWKKNDHGAYVLEYEFQILSGATRRVKIERSKKPSDSAPVTIVYDRENSRRFATYPLSLVRVVR